MSRLSERIDRAVENYDARQARRPFAEHSCALRGIDPRGDHPSEARFALWRNNFIRTTARTLAIAAGSTLIGCHALNTYYFDRRFEASERDWQHASSSGQFPHPSHYALAEQRYRDVVSVTSYLSTIAVYTLAASIILDASMTLHHRALIRRGRPLYERD